MIKATKQAYQHLNQNRQINESGCSTPASGVLSLLTQSGEASSSTKVKGQRKWQKQNMSYQDYLNKMQQSTFNKQIKRDSHSRERPLQKSMLLPESSYQPLSPTNRVAPIEFTLYNPLKKSTTSTLQNSTISNGGVSPTQNNFSFNSGSFNMHPNNLHINNFQNRVTSQQQLNQQNYNIKGLVSPHKYEHKTEGNPQDLLKHYAKNDKISTNSDFKLPPHQFQQLAQQIMTILKDKYLPSYLGKLKKDIYDDLYHLRMDFQTLKQDVKCQIKKQNQGNQTKGGSVSPAKWNKSDVEQQLSSLNTQYFLLQGKFTQIESKINDSFKRLSTDFDKIKGQLESQTKTIGMKIGTIKSSLPSIMIEYRQLFSIKRQPVSGQLSPRNKTQEQIVLSSCINIVKQACTSLIDLDI